METELYNVSQARDLLAQAGKSLQPVTIRWLARTHGIGQRVGRDWVFDPSDIAALTALPGRPKRRKVQVNDEGT